MRGGVQGQRLLRGNLTLLEFLTLLVVAGIIGAIGQSLAGFTRGGCLVSIVLGFIGALVGVWLARSLRLPELLTLNIGGTSFPIIWSIVGSALFVAVIGFLTGGRRRR